MTQQPSRPYHASTTPAKHSMPAQELSVMVERAREQRLELVRAVKHAEQRMARLAEPDGAQRLTELTRRVNELDQALTQRFDQLRRTDSQLEARQRQLNQLGQAVQAMTERLAGQLDQADQSRQAIDLASGQVRELCAGLIGEIRDKLSQAAAPIEKRLARLEQVDKTINDKFAEFEAQAEEKTGKRLERVQATLDRADKVIDQRLTQAVGAMRAEFENVAAPVRAQFERHIQEIRQQADGELATQRDQALTALASALDTSCQAIDDHTQTSQSELQTALAEQVDQVHGIVEGARRKTNQTSVRFDERAKRAAAMLKQLTAQAQQQVKVHKQQIQQIISEQLDEAVAKAVVEHRKQLQQEHEAFDQQLAEASQQRHRAHETLTQQFTDQAQQHAKDIETAHHGALSQSRQRMAAHLRDQQAELQKTMSQQLDAMAEHRKALDEAADEHIAKVRTQIDRKLELAASESQARVQASVKDADKVIDTLIKRVKDRCSDLTSDADKQTTQSLDQIRKKTQSQIEQIAGLTSDADSQMATSIDQLKAKTTSQIEQIQARLEQAHAKAQAQAQEHIQAIDRSVREQVVQAMGRAGQLTEPFRHRLDDLLTEHQQRIDVLVKMAQASIDEHVETINERIAKATGEFDQQLSALTERIDTTGQATMDKAQVKLAAQLDQMRRRADDALMPLSNQFDNMVAAHEQRMQQLIEDIQGQLRQQIVDLRSSSSAMVDLIEQQLRRKVEQIRPQTEQAMQEASTTAREHVREIEAQLIQRIEAAERQVNRRAQALAPRVAEAAREADEALRQQLSATLGRVDTLFERDGQQVAEKIKQAQEAAGDTDTADEESTATEPAVIQSQKLDKPMQAMAKRLGKNPQPAEKADKKRDDAKAA